MATVETRINSWRKGELRGNPQINIDAVVKRYNKGLRIFQKYLLEYASGLLNTSVRFQSIVKDQDEYSLPLGLENVQDFYSIIQLRVAYNVDKNGTPAYRVCQPIDFGEYNIRPLKNQRRLRTVTVKVHTLIDPSGSDEEENRAKDDNGNWIYHDETQTVYDRDGNPVYDLTAHGGTQFGAPVIRKRISMRNPRYVFISKDKIKIFPTPIKDVSMGLSLAYNFIEKEVDKNTDEDNLNLPRYFFDAIEDYLSYMLYLKENPELAQIYLQTFENTLHDNIYGLNRDQRYSEEEMMNTFYFSHN